jgi:hypothetical protein
MRIYIGYDPRDSNAYKACTESLLKYASIDVEIIPLIDKTLRDQGIYYRGYRVDGTGQMWDDRDGRPFSTLFSFTRFAVPLIEDYRSDWVLFMDADMMWRGDIADLVAEIDQTKGVMCVQHEQNVDGERLKMDGVIQNPNTHGRKNWSSLMLIKPSLCTQMTQYALNNMTGEWLHSLLWIQDDLVGSLPEEWNYLVGYSDPKINPKIVHHTLGTPDMVGKTEYDEEWWSYVTS